MVNEDYNSYNTGSSSIDSGTSTHQKSIKEAFRDGSPDEVRDRVKDAVQKGVAAVAGALKGFTEQTQKNDMPGTTKGAIHQAGETTRSTVSSVGEEVKNLKEPLKEAGQKLSGAARDIRSTAKDQIDQTKQAVKGSGSSGTGGSGTLGTSGAMGSAGAIGSTGLGSSSIGSKSGEDLTSSYNVDRSKSGQGSEMPDISRTPLAESDRKLRGKDLSSTYEDE